MLEGWTVDIMIFEVGYRMSHIYLSSSDDMHYHGLEVDMIGYIK
jgi:hypothetical protein